MAASTPKPSLWQRLRGAVDAKLVAARNLVVRILAALEDSAPEGGVVHDRFLAIDDGVNYELPLVVPDWLSPAQRQEYVAAIVAEANTVYHQQFDRPYLYRENLSQFPTADPLREWDFQTRKEVISRCHLAHERNPLAKAAVGFNTLFAMGTGLTINYRNADVEAVVEAFRKNPENAVEEYEKSFCKDIQVDGELFIRFHGEEDGRVVITPIPAWEIDYIRTARGFQRRPEMYHRVGMETDGTPGDASVIEDNEIPAAQVLHVAINRHSYELRGRPELFVILPWLKAYKDWLEGRARQNHWRGSILFDVTLDGADPSKVAAKRAQYKQPPSPGSLAIHNEKEHWQIMDSKVGAADVAEDGRQMKLMNAVGVKLPEYMLSDGENANMASATTQQLPALRSFGEFQDIFVNQVWGPVYRRVIENAINAGTLKAEVPVQNSDGTDLVDDEGKTVMVAAVDAFSLTPPELEKDDPKTLAEALQIAVNREWASDETAAARMGFDYREEQKKIERKLAVERERIAQGLRPNPFMPNLPDFPSTDGDGSGDQSTAGDNAPKQTGAKDGQGKKPRADAQQ